MAIIHKFRGTDLTETFPELNTCPNILFMTDEAHRSQYSRLAANLDKGIPHVTRIGCTGTPIAKTEQVAGDYTDKYMGPRPLLDRVTLEIFYKSQTHSAEVKGKLGMDRPHGHYTPAGHPSITFSVTPGKPCLLFERATALRDVVGFIRHRALLEAGEITICYSGEAAVG